MARTRWRFWTAPRTNDEHQPLTFERTRRGGRWCLPAFLQRTCRPREAPGRVDAGFFQILKLLAQPDWVNDSAARFHCRIAAPFFWSKHWRDVFYEISGWGLTARFAASVTTGKISLNQLTLMRIRHAINERNGTAALCLSDSK